MNKYIFYCALLLSFFKSSTVFGVDWKLLGESTIGSTYYVDVSTIRNNYGIISAWIKEEYDKPRQTGYSTAVEAMYERETIIQTRTWHIGTGAKYAENGEIVENMTDYSSKPSTPGTIEETITNFLIDWCKKIKTATNKP